MRTEAVKVGTDVYHRSTETLAGHSRVLADTDNHLATRLREVEIQLKRVSATLAAFAAVTALEESVSEYIDASVIRDEGPGVL